MLSLIIASLSLIATEQSIGQISHSGTSIQSLTFGNLIDPGINPLRPTGDYTEIQELINTANYINTQVSNAQASVIEMSMMTPGTAADANEAIVPVAGRTDAHKIDLLEAAYYNQSIVDIVNNNYYSAEHLLVQSYEDNKDEMGAAIDMFTDAAAEISKAEAVFTEAINAETDEERVELQNYIRANDVQIDQSTVQTFNQSLDTIEDKAQAATAALFASQDAAALAMINYDSQATLSNITNSTVSYDAWSDQMTVTWDNATDTVLQGMFFGNEGAVNWTKATTEVYDGFYGDNPPVSVNEMYSAYSYGTGESYAEQAPGYDVNAKLYNPTQLAMDVINVQNNSTGVTQYNSENGNLGYNGPGTMITGAQDGASDGNPGAFNSDPTLAGDRTDEFDPNLIPTFSEPVGGTGP
tara:strand:+ start:679 stop:1911 length:1233 start_codon:yes stop_codon:yes gene_type:complete